jgi:hypothetical protein
MPAARALSGTNNFVTFAKTLGLDREDTHFGVELNVNARLSSGVFLTGGVSFSNRHQNDSDVIDNPENVRFCEQDSTFRPDIKINRSYALPFDVRVSGTCQAVAGPQVAATFAVPNSTIVSALGRPLSACPATGVCPSIKSVAPLAPSSELLSMRQAFDMRFTKQQRVSRYRVQLNADLFNLFNANGIQSVNTTFSTATNTSWLNATGVQDPRQFQVSAQFDF